MLEEVAELHQIYPFVKLIRKTNKTGNTISVIKDYRSRALFTKLKTITGKACSFRTLETHFKKTYIRMEQKNLVLCKMTLSLLQVPQDQLKFQDMQVRNSDLHVLHLKTLIQLVK